MVGWRRVVLDCEDSGRSRGLLLVSALHVAAPEMRRFELVAANVTDPAVAAAIEALVWETGLRVTCTEAPPDAVLEGAALFVAIAVETTTHLPLAAARDRNIPHIAPVQFPLADAGFAVLALTRAAHDPVALARRIVECLAP